MVEGEVLIYRLLKLKCAVTCFVLGWGSIAAWTGMWVGSGGEDSGAAQSRPSGLLQAPFISMSLHS